MPNTRFCSPNFKLVWNPTKLYRVRSLFSVRSCKTAQGRCPVRGSRRPTGFMGPKRMASCPREASTSMGIQPSYTLGSRASKLWTGARWAFTSSSTKRSYSSLFMGQLR